MLKFSEMNATFVIRRLIWTALAQQSPGFDALPFQGSSFETFSLGRPLEFIHLSLEEFSRTWQNSREAAAQQQTCSNWDAIDILKKCPSGTWTP